jgi:predicted TIM-barrel fold metal-dependent hydrolase
MSKPSIGLPITLSLQSRSTRLAHSMLCVMHMKTKALDLAILATLLAHFIAIAVTPALAQGRPSAGLMIRKQDRDGDHRISRKEWLQNRRQRANTPKSTNRQPLIDVHVHIFPDASTTVEQRLAMDFDRATDVAIAVMDQNNVRTSVIMGTPSVTNLFDGQVLFAEAKRYPGRFAVLGGGGTLNPMIHRTAPADVTEEVKQKFATEAERLLNSGAVGFGEMAALHFSYYRHHPFEEVQPDHPLFLLLADIAARNNVPIDLHCEIVPRDMAVPAKLIKRSTKNPSRVHANLAGLERLLAHNRRAQIILSHSIDATGFRTAAIIRGLLERHPNMVMSLNVFPKYIFPENLPLKTSGGIRPDWLDLVKDYPDRFMVGSDQRYSAPCPGCQMANRVGPSRRWLNLLPTSIARKIAIENPQRVFGLGATR